MRIPSPPELGLPPKFTAWRAPQEDALRRLLTSHKRIRVLCAPTGFGKTAVYMAWMMLTAKPTCIVTHSRGLQDQLLNDYEPVGLVDIRGRNNYQCAMRADYTCEMGYASRCPYKGGMSCEASFAEMRAAGSDKVVTNYAKWIAAKKFGQGMQHFQQVVLDEGHEGTHALEESLQITLGAHEMGEQSIAFPPHHETQDFANWKLWAVGATAKVEEEYAALREAVRGSGQPQARDVKEMLHLKHLHKRLAMLALAKPENWVVDEVKQGYRFDPVRVGGYAESYLLMRLPSILIVSATIKPKTLFMLGVPRDAFDYIEYASDFDPKRSPLYYVPTMRVDSRATDLTPLWIKHDQFVARRSDRKGIVHTVSYARRDLLTQTSRHANRMLINEQGEAAGPIIDEFKRSPEGTILVSPAIGAGYDFPLTECEWQFICKVPFPHTSTVVKARSEDDKEYPYYMAINKLQQMVGRGMRLASDQCENLIVDEHLGWFLRRYGYLASKSFLRLVREMGTLPPPLPKL